MTTYPDPLDLDNLAQREATQLRLNDELDEGARAVFSNVETYLRAPPSRPSNVHRVPPRTVASTPARRGPGGRDPAVSRDPNANGTSNSYGTRPGGASSNGTSARRVASAGAEFRGREAAAAARSAGAPRTEFGARGGDGWVESKTSARVEAGGGGFVSVARGMDNEASTSSPLLRLSERVKGAARASGERNRRRVAGPPSLSAQLDVSIEAREHETQQASGSGVQGAGPSAGAADLHGCVDLDVSGQGRGEDGVPAGIGEEAATRFLRAKLAACQVQLEEALLAHQASKQEAVDLRKQSASEQEHARRVRRELQQLQQTMMKDSKAKEQEAASAASLSVRVGELERELSSFKRSARQAETDKKSLEVRLKRALEEVSRQKEALRQAREQNKDLGQGQRQETTRLEGQCQRLEKQKLELLSAFKKQLKLIDVLKRQKFHVEAARVLGFTEDDFVKTLDWDSR